MKAAYVATAWGTTVPDLYAGTAHYSQCMPPEFTHLLRG